MTKFKLSKKAEEIYLERIEWELLSCLNELVEYGRISKETREWVLKEMSKKENNNATRHNK